MKFTNFEDFRINLLNNMRQNAEMVRQRYTSLIILRLFPERSLNGIAPKSWASYHDDKILEDIARLTTLEAEPVISKFVLEHILAVPHGTEIENSSIKDYISSEYGVFKKDSYTRLRQALVHMGFTSPMPNGLMVLPIPATRQCFLDRYSRKVSSHSTYCPIIGYP